MNAVFDRDWGEEKLNLNKLTSIAVEHLSSTRSSLSWFQHASCHFEGRTWIYIFWWCHDCCDCIENSRWNSHLNCSIARAFLWTNRTNLCEQKNGARSYRSLKSAKQFNVFSLKAMKDERSGVVKTSQFNLQLHRMCCSWLWCQLALWMIIWMFVWNRFNTNKQ